MSQQKHQLFLPDLLAKLTYYGSRTNLLTKKHQQTQNKQRSSKLLVFRQVKVSKAQSVHRSHKSYDPYIQQRSLLHAVSHTQPSLITKQSYHSQQPSRLIAQSHHHYSNSKKQNKSSKPIRLNNPQLVYNLRMGCLASNLNVKSMERVEKSQAVRQLKEFNLKIINQRKARGSRNKNTNLNNSLSSFLLRNPSSLDLNSTVMQKHSIINNRQKLNNTLYSIHANSSNRIMQMKKLQPLQSFQYKKTFYQYNNGSNDNIPFCCPRQRLTVKYQPRGYFSEMRKISFANPDEEKGFGRNQRQGQNNGSIQPWQDNCEKPESDKILQDIFAGKD